MHMRFQTHLVSLDEGMDCYLCTYEWIIGLYTVYMDSMFHKNWDFLDNTHATSIQHLLHISILQWMDSFFLGHKFTTHLCLCSHPGIHTLTFTLKILFCIDIAQHLQRIYKLPHLLMISINTERAGALFLEKIFTCSTYETSILNEKMLFRIYVAHGHL